MLGAGPVPVNGTNAITPIDTAVTRNLATPAPVFILDIRVLIDLFRSDAKRPLPARTELQAAAGLLAAARADPTAAHVVVPELVPREFADNARKCPDDLEEWCRGHDDRGNQIAALAAELALPRFAAPQAAPLGLPAALPKLAGDLFGCSNAS